MLALQAVQLQNNENPPLNIENEILPQDNQIHVGQQDPQDQQNQEGNPMGAGQRDAAIEGENFLPEFLFLIQEQLNNDQQDMDNLNI